MKLSFSALTGTPPEGGDIEERARSMLRLVLANSKSSDSNAVIADPATCPNCGVLCGNSRSPYCSGECREIAGFVRQMRAGLTDGGINDPERQVAFGQNLWFLLGGGRPLRIHLIPEKSRQLVMIKSGGKCTLCGAEATTVDHIATGCNRPINLRAVCERCNRAKPFGDPTVLNQASAQALLNELAARIAAPASVRCCDDPVTWDWRAYLAARV